MFIDYVKIYVKAGDGGNGCVSFRREKFVPRGGPDGGNGGDGGSVILEGDRGLWTLVDFKYNPQIKGKRGEHGKGKDCNGRKGEDLVVKVPLGVVVKDAHTGQVIGEILENEQKIVIAKGGKGGKGNKAFVSPTNRTPRIAEPGLPGEEKWIELELKLIADIGLIGVPNAGKSTLINRLSSTQSKTAPYPFTTITPVLGVVEIAPYKHIVVADMPGIIRDAHKGKGLGDRFLRHIERVGVLFLIIDFAEKPKEDYEILMEELALYSGGVLLKKKRVVVANKMDIPGARERVNDFIKETNISKEDIVPISALTGEGVDGLIEKMKKVGPITQR